MTTPELDTTTLRELAEMLIGKDPDGMAQAMTGLLNESMLAERESVLGASRYQRSDGRKGYANGFRPKVLNTRVGEETPAGQHTGRQFVFHDRVAVLDRALLFPVPVQQAFAIPLHHVGDHAIVPPRRNALQRHLP